jgi:hypothetical protein
MIFGTRTKVFLINLLNLLDLYLTNTFMTMGMLEFNPVMDYLFNLNLGWIKIFVVLIPSLVLTYYYKECNKRKNIQIILWFGILVLSAVNIYNVVGFYYTL